MKIILASGSPRRREILKRDFDFEIISPKIKEDKDHYEDGESLVMALAYEKAYQVAKDYKNSLVIGADTLVMRGSQPLGKPKNRKDAYNMLKSLSNIKHRVITGFALINIDKKIKYVDFESSYVYFKDLKEKDIIAYLDTGEYKDKAGSYGIQGYGSNLVLKYEGDFDNIVGLPYKRIKEYIEKING